MRRSLWLENRDSFVGKGSLEPVIEDLVVTVYMKKCEQILSYSWLQSGWVGGIQEEGHVGNDSRIYGFQNLILESLWHDSLTEKAMKEDKVGSGICEFSFVHVVLEVPLRHRSE